MERLNVSARSFRGKGEQIAVAISRGALEGLAFIHQKGFIHRDIKPANIMISDDGHVKLSIIFFLLLLSSFFFFSFKYVFK